MSLSVGRYLDWMAYDFQVTFDCSEPHVLADWWADAIGWEVEPTDEHFIREMVGKGFASEDETTTYKGALVWKAGAAINHPETPPGALRRRILFQLVAEPKTVKNRVHLDMRVGPERAEQELERLVGKGATFLHRANQGPHSWITIADPEGNELCLS